MRKKPTPLKLAIASQGFVQADIAQQVGISETRLSRIANGRVRPTEAELRHLAHALGVEKEVLV
jgi:transcriptional regulator with XRE-family HTH domain